MSMDWQIKAAFPSQSFWKNTPNLRSIASMSQSYIYIYMVYFTYLFPMKKIQPWTCRWIYTIFPMGIHGSSIRILTAPREVPCGNPRRNWTTPPWRTARRRPPWRRCCRRCLRMRRTRIRIRVCGWGVRWRWEVKMVGYIYIYTIPWEWYTDKPTYIYPKNQPFM